MAEFLEERLPIDVRMGATYADEFAVQITTTAGGQEYRQLVHPYPLRHFSVHFTLATADLWQRVIDLYHRAYGMYAGFRVQCMDDFSTCNDTGTPTATDQPLALVSTGVYQLQKQYGAGASPITIGLPLRTLHKPVAGTAAVGIQGVTVRTSDWSVNATNGQVTFAADMAAANVSGISKAAQAVITFASTHGFLVGQAVHISGVAGMTQINGQRALITATTGTTITVAINSTTYSTYGSGGAVHTRPQAGEAVTGGCQFDLPCRFNSRIDIQHIAAGVREAGTIDIVELVTP